MLALAGALTVSFPALARSDKSAAGVVKAFKPNAYCVNGVNATSMNRWQDRNFQNAAANGVVYIENPPIDEQDEETATDAIGEGDFAVEPSEEFVNQVRVTAGACASTAQPASSDFRCRTNDATEQASAHSLADPSDPNSAQALAHASPTPWHEAFAVPGWVDGGANIGTSSDTGFHLVCGLYPGQKVTGRFTNNGGDHLGPGWPYPTDPMGQEIPATAEVLGTYPIAA